MAGQGPAAHPAAHPAAVAALVDADHLEELGVGSGRIQGLKNPDGSRRELDVVALVKVHGRAATKGIERIDAGLAGHDQAGAGMGRCAGAAEEGESRPAGRRAVRPDAAADDKGGGDAAGTIWPVAGGRPGCSNRPHSRGSAGGILGDGSWRRRGLGSYGAWSGAGAASICGE